MPELSLSLLGGFTVSLDGRPAHAFRSQKARALLAYLVMEAGRPHERAALAALFWPEMPDAPALRNLTQTLVGLRQVIGDGDPPWLLLNRRQVTWNAPAAIDVDARRFLGLVERSHAPAAPHPLQEAVALYRGEFLAGFGLSGCPAFDEWLLVQREYFRRLALDALSRLTGDTLAAGDYPAAAELARRQLAIDRWREEAVRQLLLALAAGGRHSEALAEYESARRLLAQELDVAPQPETTQLAEAIRHGETGFRRPADGGFARKPVVLQSPDLPIPHNLPIRLTTLMGRESELAALSGLLREPDTRLVTISGIGGVGKTRLALAVALAFVAPPAPDAPPLFPDGVWFASLDGVVGDLTAGDADLEEGERFVTAIAGALGLSFGREEDRPAQLGRSLRDRRLLLVLDNYEHPAATRPILLDLLHNAPGVRVLITSHEQLGVGGERVLSLQGLPLPSPEAVADKDTLLANSCARLFFNRALERGVHLTLDEAERAGLARICLLAEGLPLAIELAAIWAGHFTCAEIAAEMAANLDFLSAESAAARLDLPDRQRSPRAAFDYSWRLLPAGEQRALAQLALLHGSFSREAALAVTDARLVDLIGLLNKSLLRQVAPGWYAMHSLVCRFAGEQLRLMPDGEEAAMARLAAYFLHFVAMRERVWNGPTPQQARGDIQPVMENVRLAWQWAVQHHAWESLDDALFGLVAYYRSEGLYAETLEVLRQLAGPLQDLPDLAEDQARLLAKALSYQAAIRMRLDMKADAGLGITEIAIEVARRSGDPLAQQFTHYIRGYALLLAATQGAVPPREFGHIHDLLEQSLAFGRQVPMTNRRDKSRAQAMEVQCLNFLGNFRMLTGEKDEARRHYEAALTLCAETNSALCEGVICNSIAELLEIEGDYERALGYRERALRGYRQINEPDSVSATLGTLCGVLTYLGDYSRALEHGRAALELRQRHGLIGHLLYHRLGLAAFGLGDDEQVLRWVADALAETPEAAGVYQFRLLAGECYTRQGRWLEAAEALRAASVLAQEGRNPPALMTIRRALADLALAQGQAAAALAHVEGLLPFLAGPPLPGSSESLRLYWTCYSALRANDDPRADGILAAACALLQSRAALISDETRRRTFVHGIDVNRKILRMTNDE